MIIDILSERENPFLKRKELMLLINHSGQSTPKKIELEDKIAEKFKADKEKIEIIYIFSDAGIARSRVKARIWEEKIIKKEKVEEKPKEEEKEEKPEKETKESEKKEKSEEIKEEGENSET